MLSWFKPIRTQQGHSSLLAIVAINSLWFCNLFHTFITINALVFTVKHYTDDTRLIALATSMSYAFSFLLGPVCNYLSDRIWTPLGRRRPFIVLGWCAAGIAMALIPLMPTYGALITLIIGYTLLMDISTPLEPLCMEVIPPAQRGRSMAIRQIMVQACALLYFQVLFPRFDDHLHLPKNLPVIGGWSFTGEQLIYAVASFLFFVMVAFLLLCVREVKVPDAPNVPLRDLHFAPIKATRAFILDTFGDRRWWWIYLLYCASAAFGASWGSLQALLLTDQFGYSKPNIALMTLPSMVWSILAVMPLMGWYSDRQEKLSYRTLWAIGLGSLALLWYTTQPQLAIPRNTLPSIPWLLGLGALATVGVCALFLVAAQWLLSLTGNAGARVWLYTLSLFFQIAQAFGCWLLIQHAHSAGQFAPAMVVWFLFDQLRTTLRACTDVVTGPMYFDFVPRDRMGTLSSGFGFTNSLVLFSLANFAGYWVQLNSGSGVKNYGSAYLLQVTIGVICMIALGLFIAAFRKGKIIEYGRLGLAAHQSAEALEVPLTVGGSPSP